MTLDYQKIWNVMNELEMVTSKIVSSREILDSAVDRLQEHQYDKAETLMYAADEFLQYYLEEFDRKFKDAWAETVTKVHEQEYNIDAAGNYVEPYDISTDYKGAWNSFWRDDAIKEDMETLSSYYPLQSEELIIGNKPRDYYENVAPSATQRDNDKVVKWRLPIEEVKDSDTDETEYFITFPDDLLEATNLKPGDEVEWVDRNDGSFLLRKTTQPKTYTEMIEAGYTMTADGFWIKEC